MNLFRLVWRESVFRRGNFILTLISIAIAIACLVGVQGLLRVHDRKTDQILSLKEAETKKKLDKLNDDYRKITKNLGFNVLILPKDQNLSDLYADDYAEKYMPEEYVHRLANSRIATIDHLLPSLQQKLVWPEQKRTILLIGVRGEIPIVQKELKKPLIQPVPEGTAVLGWELKQSLGLEKGDDITFMGQKFAVHKVHPARGSKDDITMWINLSTAQKLLNKEGQINGIMALNCHCEGDRLGQIRAEISGILPETQVIEFASEAIARAEARDRAEEHAIEALQAEKIGRIKLRNELENFASFLIPLALLVAAIWIAFLGMGNVRERRQEIGILRALGFGSRQILAVFLSRSLLVGVVGGLAGCILGLIVYLIFSAQSSLSPSLTSQEIAFLVIGIIAAPILSLIASWIPAMSAIQQHPAEVLRDA